jgi:NADH dehydrogenase/NADH:ubiquinone oxidoreductase subunit G
VNVEGRVQELVQVERFPDGAVSGYVRPDWRIFSDLAECLGGPSLAYGSAADVLADISRTIPGFPARADRTPRRLPAVPHLPAEEQRGAGVGEGAFWLVAEPSGYRFRGIDIASKVGGLAELALEEGFRMHPEDLEALGLKDGDTISLENGKLTVTGAARSKTECPRGTIYITRPLAFGGLSHRRDWAPLYALELNPVRVNVSAAVLR